MRMFKWFRGKKSEATVKPTEVMCYPTKDRILIRLAGGKEEIYHSIDPMMKIKFKEMVKWFNRKESLIFELSYEGGSSSFSRKYIQYIKHYTELPYV